MLSYLTSFLVSPAHKLVHEDKPTLEPTPAPILSESDYSEYFGKEEYTDLMNLPHSADHVKVYTIDVKYVDYKVRREENRIEDEQILSQYQPIMIVNDNVKTLVDHDYFKG